MTTNPHREESATTRATRLNLLNRLASGDALHQEAAAEIKRLRQDLADEIKEGQRAVRDAIAEERWAVRDRMEGL